MAYSKTQIIEALQKVTATETSKNLVEAGHVKNVQVFGDEVVVDVWLEGEGVQRREVHYAQR